MPGRASGTLDGSDRVAAFGAVADDYVLSLRAGEAVTLVARGGASRTRPGSTLDVLEILLLNGREVARDDDSATDGAARNSRIVYTPSASGDYTLRVTTFGPALKEGAYTVETWRGARPDQR